MPGLRFELALAGRRSLCSWLEDLAALRSNRLESSRGPAGPIQHSLAGWFFVGSGSALTFAATSLLVAHEGGHPGRSHR
jgi:hypothetical protein